MSHLSLALLSFQVLQLVKVFVGERSFDRNTVNFFMATNGRPNQVTTISSKIVYC